MHQNDYADYGKFSNMDMILINHIEILSAELKTNCAIIQPISRANTGQDL